MTIRTAPDPARARVSVRARACSFMCWRRIWFVVSVFGGALALGFPVRSRAQDSPTPVAPSTQVPDPYGVPQVATPRRAFLPAVPPSPSPSPSRIPLRVALQTEAALGVATGDFYNQLLGVRFDLQFSQHAFFGGYVGYANLKGKNGRAHDSLLYAQAEYLAGDPASRVRVPVRFASGYLPGNGPVVRAAVGLDFAITPRIHLVTEFLAPMIWLTNNQMLLSLNGSVELAFRL